MKLVKTVVSSSIITLLRISAGFISTKVLAIFTGPTGVAMIGQFANFVTIILTFANGAVNTGVTKYTAERSEDKAYLQRLFSTAIKLSLYCSFFTGLILFLFAKPISSWIFTDPSYSNVVRVFGITIFLYAVNTLLVAILNGLKQIKLFTIVNLVGSLTGLALTLILVYFFKIYGALYAMVLAQSIVCLVTCGFIYKSEWFSWDYFNGKIDKKIILNLSKFALMTIVSAIMLPLSQIILRNLLIKHIGIESAGYWQGMMKISDGYLLVITTALTTYYLPKLSSLKRKSELRKEIYFGYKLIIPSLLILTGSVYFCRHLIIDILYAKSFAPMADLFFYQLLGDLFKLCAWILGYLMVSKAMTKVFIISEIVFSIIYVILSYYLVLNIGLKGIVIAFAVNYAFYWLFLIAFFRRILFK